MTYHPPTKASPLQVASRIATVGIVIAILYAAYTLYSRHADDERATRELAAKQDAARQSAVKRLFGEGEIKIISFSIDRASVHRGEAANLCYGTVNASEVKIDPPVEPVKPSSFHCMSLTPKTSTTYTFTALNGKGESKTVSARLEVR